MIDKHADTIRQDSDKSLNTDAPSNPIGHESPHASGNPEARRQHPPLPSSISTLGLSGGRQGLERDKELVDLMQRRDWSGDHPQADTIHGRRTWSHRGGTVVVVVYQCISEGVIDILFMLDSELSDIFGSQPILLQSPSRKSK